ncbi:unnamed protein product [Macrosiphum euphorbiae]|uniref:Uncharacterized protein n=1 Tax=Macrosiphum euphorbiae TaxID=13131 RepID=A0AAV0WBZ1_9HEMI|nr:unnamed protein product [Macrosiphum euphorbiae]
MFVLRTARFVGCTRLTDPRALPDQSCCGCLTNAPELAAFSLLSVVGVRCWPSLVTGVDPLVFGFNVLYSLPSVPPPLAGTGIPFPVGTTWRWG